MNKGEWSEVYVFLKLLADGVLHLGDENLNKVSNDFFRILSVIKEETRVLDFVIEDEYIVVYDAETKQSINRFSQSTLHSPIERLLSDLQASGNQRFEVREETVEYIHNMPVERIKSGSADKADIRVCVHDPRNPAPQELGFSIKSRFGSPSTLLNPGMTTRFTFEISNGMTEGFQHEFNSNTSHLRHKLHTLVKDNYNLSFVGIKRGKLQRNLQMIDSLMPEIVALMLLEYYMEDNRNLLDAVNRLELNNPLSFDNSEGHEYYKYKVKKFLIEIATGMMPNTVWNGIVDATGGYIIVREDGEIICFHLYNRNAFEDYLLNETRFDTPSTSRFDFGHIYKDENSNRYYIDLCLQIRFKK